MELTQENFDKLINETENYKKAVQEERTKRRTAVEQLEEFETKTSKELEELKTYKSNLEQEDAKKKGNYEELISQKDLSIQELTEKFASAEDKATKYDLFLNKTLEEKMSKIPEEKREFINKVLNDKTHEDKLDILEGFIADYSKPADFNNEAKGGDKEHKDTSEYDKAKESGSVIGLIGNAKIIE